MTQEEKQLLLQYLSAMFPYGVVLDVDTTDWKAPQGHIQVKIEGYGIIFHRKFKYEIDTLFSTWMEDLMNYTLDTFPYLRRRKEFDLWFNLPNEKEPIRMTVIPKKQINDGTNLWRSK